MHLLVVEDDPRLRGMLERLLVEDRHVVATRRPRRTQRSSSALLIGALAELYPAVRAARISPTEALRSV